MSKIKVMVMCGGNSPERDVSLASGAAVEAALNECGYEATLLDADSLYKAVYEAVYADMDSVVFIAMHGGWGEDGRLQAALDLRRIPYTGSGPAACRIAMNKPRALEKFREAGLLTPPGIIVTPEHVPDMSTLIAEWGRVVIKPASGGSTVGVVIAEEAIRAEIGFGSAWETDDVLLVEKYIPGRELTCAVFGDEALPPIEIRPRSGFYDYQSKYTKGETEYLCPAPLDDKLTARVKDAALRAHRALGCRTYSRADFRLSESGELYVLEVNTAPGMTSTSLVPKAAAAAGWSFPELVRRIVDDAMGY